MRAKEFTPKDIHKLADSKGVKWDNEPSFLKLTKQLTGKEHLDDLNQEDLKKVKQHLEKIKESFDDSSNAQTLEERRTKKRRVRRAIYGPGPYGWYGYDAGYSGSSSDGGSDGGGGESMKNENFADGKNPQDKGDAKRHGVNTKASVSSLRKTAKQGGRKGQLAHWMANMKAGRAK